MRRQRNLTRGRMECVDERRAQKRRTIFVAAAPRKMDGFGGAHGDAKLQRLTLRLARGRRQRFGAERTVEGRALLVGDERIFARRRRNLTIDQAADNRCANGRPASARTSASSTAAPRTPRARI